MTEDNLAEFLNERVLPTREVHHIAYPVDLDSPAVGVMLDSPEDGMCAVILPVFSRGLLHLEIHWFADGERTNPERLVGPANGSIELTLRKPPLIN